jgi:hypothetical protein
MTLAHAIEDAGIERAKAERVASAIVDLIHDEVATKADVAAVKADVAALSADLRRTEISLKADIPAVRGALKADVAAVRADLALVEHRLLTRLGGGLIVVAVGVLFAALHYWPPH